MTKGFSVMTPRFGMVKIAEIFENEDAARRAGYTETTHYWDDPEFGVYGKSIDMYHMQFAAFKKEEK